MGAKVEDRKIWPKFGGGGGGGRGGGGGGGGGGWPKFPPPSPSPLFKPSSLSPSLSLFGVLCTMERPLLIFMG